MQENKFVGKLLKYLPLAVGAMNVIFYLIVFSADKAIKNITYNSIWEIADIVTNNNGIHLGALGMIVLFVIDVILLLVGIGIFLKRKNAKGLYVISGSNTVLSIGMLILQFMFKVREAGGVFLLILIFLLSVGSLVSTIFYQIKFKDAEVTKEIKEPKVVEFTKTKKSLLIMDIISFGGLLSLFFIPLFSYKEGVTKHTFWLVQALSSEGANMGVQLAFIGVLLTFMAILIYFIHSIAFYFNYEKIFVNKSHTLIYSSFAISLVYFIAGYVVTLINNMSGKEATTISFIPMIIMTIILLYYSIMKGRYHFIDQVDELERKTGRLEPLLYLAILTILSLGLLFVRVIEVYYKYGSNEVNQGFTGLELLQNRSEVGGGHQVLAFIILAVILTSIVLLIVCTCSFFAKNKDYHKMTKMSIYTNVIMLFVLGMSGFYFSIAQKINEENILALFEVFGFNINIEYVTEIRSQTIFLFFGALLVLLIAIFRGQLNLDKEEVIVTTIDNNAKGDQPEQKEDEVVKQQVVVDPCPVFSELDEKKPFFDKLLEKKKEYTFVEPTLPDVVQFIVDYARESRLHLSYTPEDIATFIAGLGASRLTILQGMSGTGKTSLPKIFSEAILGNCEIVEVESSWRDKNELLGYYNEFSKSYSPKKFTERLYKAKLNPEVVTFIVLDEMNLSRIEYYFSDFLSLMEHEEHKREIKLLNVKLHKTIDDEVHNYLGLFEGHTIKIPTNVWFIGTANRDESTFEISDKVYDRAQTMNFNKRAPKVRSFTKPIPQRFLTYKTFSNLLKDAINNGSFEAEDYEVIKEVEKILQPFNISFGNRVLKQIEEFVKIYCACFNNDEEVLFEAVEKILLSKVVAKLEFKNVDNKDKLVKQFNKLKLYACSEFVSKLNED